VEEEEEEEEEEEVEEEEEEEEESRKRFVNLPCKKVGWKNPSHVVARSSYVPYLLKSKKITTRGIARRY
jgi:hypothetical protein